MLKRLLIITIHALYGLGLGYFFMFALMHLASIGMQSDDDLNRAIAVGVFFWPVLIGLAGWTGNELYKNGLRISKAGKLGYMLISLFSGVIVADCGIGISFSIFEWETRVNVNMVILLNLLAWGIFAIFIAWMISVFLKRFALQSS